MAKRFIAFFLVAVLAGCAAVPEGQKFTSENFRDFISQVKLDAINKGISKETTDAALDAAEYLPKVVELYHKQPEKVKTFDEYIDSVLPAKRIRDANQAYQKNRVVLRKISAKYGVDAKVIVALWGMESNFGSNMGNYNVISSLATLAYDGRRREFFQSELLNALKIIDTGNVKSAAMRGSWAGAMGQNQFMPSTFLSYAIDEDGDGRKDIWNDRADVFGSIANYLHNLGWQPGQAICRKIDTPGNESENIINLGENEHYMVYDNFHRLMKWNRSNYFATSICLLAGAIR